MCEFLNICWDLPANKVSQWILNQSKEEQEKIGQEISHYHINLNVFPHYLIPVRFSCCLPFPLPASKRRMNYKAWQLHQKKYNKDINILKVDISRILKLIELITAEKSPPDAYPFFYFPSFKVLLWFFPVYEQEINVALPVDLVNDVTKHWKCSHSPYVLSINQLINLMDNLT